MENETIGRKWKTTRYGLHSRRVGTNDWYGFTKYKTLEEAQKALKELGGRYINVGGITVDFGDAKDHREYRIVKSECEHEVLETHFRVI
jgi:hypothetical protein